MCSIQNRTVPFNGRCMPCYANLTCVSVCETPFLEYFLISVPQTLYHSVWRRTIKYSIYLYKSSFVTICQYEAFFANQKKKCDIVSKPNKNNGSLPTWQGRTRASETRLSSPNFPNFTNFRSQVVLLYPRPCKGPI